jgi:tyrosine-protein kinase Etk/Wzc
MGLLESPESAIQPRDGAVGQCASQAYGLSTDAWPWSTPYPAATADSALVAMWHNRWIVLICVLGALATGAIYIRTAMPLYTSTAQLYLDHAGPRIPDVYAPGATPQMDKYLNTQAGIIRSGPILSSVADALASRHLRTFADIDAPVSYLKKRMLVKVGNKDEIISVSLNSSYSSEAAEIVNCVVNTYMASRSEHEQKSSVQVLNILQGQMTQASTDLEKKRNALTEFQANHTRASLNPDQGEGGMLRGAYLQAKIKLLDTEAFLESVRELCKNPIALRQYLRGKDGTNPFVGADQERAPLEVQMAAVESERDTLLGGMLTPVHPEVVRTTNEIARIKLKLAELDDRFVKAATHAAEQEYAEAKKRLDGIAPLLEEHQKQAREWSAEATQFQWLKSDVDALTAHRQTLDEKIRQVQMIVGEDISQSRMAILESATPAEVPSAPRKGIIMQMALMLGLLLGGAVVCVREGLGRRLRPSVDGISSLLGLPVLGTIPVMSRRQRIQEMGQKTRWQPSSLEAEAFRTIQTALLFGTRKGRVKTLSITSPFPRDGKSTLVSNLAIAMAHAGQKTLILDVDLRNPVQHTIFEMDHWEQCLSRVLEGKMKLGDAIQATGVKGLHLLTCGINVPCPAKILNSRLFARVLQVLSDAYDRILIDTPPVGLVADAQIIGALSDATLLVVKAEKRTGNATQYAIDALRTVGAWPVGVVVNCARRPSHHYGYYYGKYRRYENSESSNSSAGKPKEMAAIEGNAREPDAPSRLASGNGRKAEQELLA